METISKWDLKAIWNIINRLILPEDIKEKKTIFAKEARTES